MKSKTKERKQKNTRKRKTASQIARQQYRKANINNETKQEENIENKKLYHALQDWGFLVLFPERQHLVLICKTSKQAMGPKKPPLPLANGGNPGDKATRASIWLLSTIWCRSEAVPVLPFGAWRRKLQHLSVSTTVASIRLSVMQQEWHVVRCL